MSSTMDVIKTLIVPAVISLIIFIATTYILLPLWRQYRNRYAQYLPLETISTSTSSLRSRIQAAISRWFIPSQFRGLDPLAMADGDSDAGFMSDEGEELGNVDDERRRALSLDNRNDDPESVRRLSRDLEEGFRDDSEDEDDNRARAR